MTRQPKRTSIANAFGALGYISVFFQWTWSLLLFVYPIITENPELLLPQDNAASNTGAFEFDPAFAPLATIIAIVVTVAIIALTAVVLVRLPKTIGKKAAEVTRATASTVIPAITRHKKISKKKRERLSYRIVLGIKCGLIILPVVSLVFVRPIEQLGESAMWIIALFAAICSIFYFIVQQAIALVGKIAYKDLW